MVRHCVLLLTILWPFCRLFNYSVYLVFFLLFSLFSISFSLLSSLIFLFSFFLSFRRRLYSSIFSSSHLWSDRCWKVVLPTGFCLHRFHLCVSVCVCLYVAIDTDSISCCWRPRNVVWQLTSITSGAWLASTTSASEPVTTVSTRTSHKSVFGFCSIFSRVYSIDATHRYDCWVCLFAHWLNMIQRMTYLTITCYIDYMVRKKL